MPIIEVKNIIKNKTLKLNNFTRNAPKIAAIPVKVKYEPSHADHWDAIFPFSRYFV